MHNVIGLATIDDFLLVQVVYMQHGIGIIRRYFSIPVIIKASITLYDYFPFFIDNSIHFLIQWTSSFITFHLSVKNSVVVIFLVDEWFDFSKNRLRYFVVGRIHQTIFRAF